MPAAHNLTSPSANATEVTLSGQVPVVTSHSARIAGLVTYLAQDGQRCPIPKGPCLLEERADAGVDVIWGLTGQNCTTLARGYVEKAKERGRVVLLD